MNYYYIIVCMFTYVCDLGMIIISEKTVYLQLFHRTKHFCCSWYTEWKFCEPSHLSMYKNSCKIPGGSINLSPQMSYLGKKCHWHDSKGIKWWQDLLGKYGGKSCLILTKCYLINQLLVALIFCPILTYSTLMIDFEKLLLAHSDDWFWKASVEHGRF